MSNSVRLRGKAKDHTCPKPEVQCQKNRSLCKSQYAACYVHTYIDTHLYMHICTPIDHKRYEESETIILISIKTSTLVATKSVYRES